MTRKESPYWHTPYYIDAPDLQPPMDFPEKVEICDLTLDENGEGMAGAYMTEDEKLGLAQLLDEIGIHRLGVMGYPSPIAKENVEAVKKITGLGLKAKTQSLVSSKEDIDSALEAGVWGVTIRKPCSNLYSVVFEPVEKKVADFLTLANYARKHGLIVGMMAQDITRAIPKETEQLLCSIQDEFGLDEITLTDSQGLGNPFTINYIVRKVRSWMNVPIAVHCHNMLSMGVANACAAVAAGASIVHTTVNGVGHFAGMPPTEEVAVALAIGYGIEMDIQYNRLVELARKVEKLTRVPMHRHKPVSGETMFSRSEEIPHIQELIDSERLGMAKAYFPYMPDFVGGEARVVMGQRVTPLAVQYNLGKLGLTVSDDQLAEIHKQVHQRANLDRSIVTNEQLYVIAQKVLNK